MTIAAFTFIPVSNSERIQCVEYASALVTPRTLLKALRSVSGKRHHHAPEISINGKHFRAREIHDLCYGCHDIGEATWFLNKVGA